MSRLLACLAVLVAVMAGAPANAQESIDPAHADPGDNSAIVPPGAVDSPLDSGPARPRAAARPAAADTPTIEIDRDACRLAETNIDDYVPGVDVHGNPVAPADLPDSQAIHLPSRFAIPITDDLARRMGLPREQHEWANLGVVTVDDGRLAFNGQPIGDDGASAVAEACHRMRPQRTGKAAAPPAFESGPGRAEAR